MRLAFIALILAAILGGRSAQGEPEAPAPADSATFELGTIRFEAPQDWEMDLAREVWRPRDHEHWGREWTSISWCGPFRATEEPLEEQLAAFRGGKGTGRVLRKPEFAVASGIRAAWELHRVPDPLDATFLLDAIFLCRGSAHFFRLSDHGSADKMLKTIEEIRPHLESIRERELKPPLERGRIGRMKLKEKGVDVAGFLHRFDVPNFWKTPEDAEESNHLRTWFVERTVGDKTFRFPVVCEVGIGEVSDARLALSRWLVTRARPEPPDERVRITGRSELEFWSGTLESGARIWGLAIMDEAPGGWVAVLAGFLVQQNGARLLIGTSIRAEARAEGPWFQSAHLPYVFGAATRCALDLPPTRETGKAFLIQKKRYRYSVDSEIDGDYADLSSHARQTITFHLDGTCDIDENEGYLQSVSGRRYVPDNGQDLTLGGEGVDGFATWTKSGSGFYNWRRDSGTGSETKIRGAAFEVRGASEDDLWLVIHRPPTRVTFHRLQPDAKGRYGSRSTPHGLAIDGRIEGEYVWYARDGAWAPWKD